MGETGFSVQYGQALSLLSLDNENQLPHEGFSIGMYHVMTCAQLEAEHNIKPFFAAVRKFYLAAIKKMLK